MISRREFVTRCAAATFGTLLGSGVARPKLLSQPFINFPSLARDRVAIASYPFREFISGSEHRSGNPVIELKDFAAHVIEKFHVHRIEPWSAHFPSTDARYLTEFRAALDKSKAFVVDIAADGESSPYAANRAEREAAAAFSKKWIDVAAALGSPSVRTNIPEAKDAKANADVLSETLRPVVDYAADKNVVVHLENDNPVSEDPFFLVQVIEKLNSPWLRALPDFGNTVKAHDKDYAYRAIDKMFAYAYGICHVKNGELDPQGKFAEVDLARTFGILKAHNFKGYCSIEYDAPGDPYKPTGELVEQTVTFLS